MTKLSMIQGDTKAFTLTLYDDDGTTPLDLEGDPSEFGPTVTFTARKYQHSADIVKTSDDGIELGAGDGEIIITLDPEDTNDLDIPFLHPYTSYTLIWDVEVDTDGVINTRRRGTLVLYPQVTEAEEA